MIKISNDLCLVLEQNDTVIIFFFEYDDGYDGIRNLLTPFITFAQEQNRMPETTEELLTVIISGLENLNYDEEYIFIAARDLLNLFFKFCETYNHYPENLTELVELIEEYAKDTFGDQVSVTYL